MSNIEPSYLRLVRPPQPLGAYIRPMERDYRHAATLVASGLPVASGFVVDARKPALSEDLRQALRSTGAEVVLDPQSVDLATLGGRERSRILDLPWATDAIDGPDTFSRSRISDYAATLAETALEMDATAVLAPSHYFESLPHPWIDVDLELTQKLRSNLDRDSRGRSVRIYYPLVTTRRVLSLEPTVSMLINRLRDLAASGVIDAVWLRMHNFGTSKSGPVRLKAYMAGARSLHAIGVPLVGEHTGAIGLALMAFGAVSGIESGVTHGEHFDLRPLLKPRKRSKGGYAPRVYFPEIAAFLKREPAAALLSGRSTRNTFTCQSPCCTHGRVDMLHDPRRHFLIRRFEEVRNLSRVPQTIRVEHYFSNWLRLAADRASLAAQVVPSLSKRREELDRWRATLTDVREGDMERPPSISPEFFPEGQSQRGSSVEGH